MLTVLIILCSILGIAGAILNCIGKLKHSYMLWVIGNVGWIVVTIITEASVFTIFMWVTYASTSVIGLYSFSKKDKVKE